MQSSDEQNQQPTCEGTCVSSQELVSIFYPDASQLGYFKQVESDRIPEVYRSLLNHTKHMTVTVEAHHADQVDVEVIQSNVVGNHYRREILLKTHSTQKVVQYGIVRLDTRFLSEEPKREILAQKKPLGRVLIEHNVLREIQLFDLLEVQCGPVLAKYFGLSTGAITYGRTALLYCDNDPAIELLEIVTL